VSERERQIKEREGEREGERERETEGERERVRKLGGRKREQDKVCAQL